MWESPIKTICDEMQTQFEGEVLKAVQRVGIEVDKDQLIKALNYDRNQYAEGYKHGYSYAKSELIRCKDCKYWTYIRRTNRYWCKTDDGLYDLNPSPDDFCSRAERRSDDGE